MSRTAGFLLEYVTYRIFSPTGNPEEPNIETNKLGRLESSDLSWSQQTATERYLEPINGAAMKILTEPFDKIDLTYLKGVQLTKDKISGSDNNNFLQPGTVLAVRTVNGNFAKLKVTRYYKLHDFTFPGSEVLNQGWKESVLQSPNRDYYHIEVEWVLYKAK
jgi:hypothetical protein